MCKQFVQEPTSVESMPFLCSYIYSLGDNLPFSICETKAIKFGLITDLLFVWIYAENGYHGHSWVNLGLPRKIFLINRIHAKHNHKLAVKRKVSQGRSF